MVYAIVAAGLIFWLRSILGTRSQDEMDQPAPRLELGEDGKVINLDAPDTQKTPDKLALIEQLAENPKDNMSIAGPVPVIGLTEIAKADRDFDVYEFLKATQDVFVYVVESFADGDRDTLQNLLSAEVFDAFDGAITDRERAGETMQAEIQSIQKSEIVEARLDGKQALVTVRFFADEVSVTYDEDQTIIAGHPDKPTQMRDLWTFARNIKSRDPRWLVVETREDGVNDIETIPNTH